MTTRAVTSHSTAPDPIHAVLYELRHLVAHARLTTATERSPDDDHVCTFADGTHLLTLNRSSLAQPVEDFVIRSVQLTEALVESDHLSIGPAGPSVDGIGLDRILIAYELANRYGRQNIEEWTSGRSQWRQDICHILSFFSQMAQRRYEKSTAQMTVAYYPVPPTSTSIRFGQLGKPLLDEYKALLRLCRDAHTVLCVNQDVVICRLRSDLHAAVGGMDDLNRPPIPPRLRHLRALTDNGIEPVVFNLNANGSIEILANCDLVFRQVNNVWRLVTLEGALIAIRKELEAIPGAHNPALVAHNFLSLALDLADRGEGALPFLCDEPSTDVLNTLFDSREGLIRRLPGWPASELSARTRFTQLVGRQGLSLSASIFSQLSPLLRDVCSIDGATIFSYGGDLLGFGCIVNSASMPGNAGAAARREGARSAAAKAVSRKGIAIKVSTDGDATLFLRGEEWATFC